jgi:dibenzofuran dioxygenase beta subunit
VGALHGTRVIDWQTQVEVEQFLYREARLLDAGQFEAWLELFADEVRYWVPIRESTETGAGEFPAPEAIAVAHIDDDRRGLELRVQRLRTGMAHAETPPSRVRHLIANVEVEPLDGAGRVLARSNFLIFQGRREHAEFLFSGRREDELRRLDAGWRIARRFVFLDHTILPRSISVFF